MIRASFRAPALALIVLLCVGCTRSGGRAGDDRAPAGPQDAAMGEAARIVFP